jgi:uncharacterized protein YecE (DUF72 family)
LLPQANGKVHVERLQRDGAAALGTDEARALVERDAPELLALLEELKDSLQELRSRVGPVLAQVPPAAAQHTALALDAVQCQCRLSMVPAPASGLCHHAHERSLLQMCPSGCAPDWLR